MTETIERELRKSLSRGLKEFDSFAIPNATSHIDRRETVPLPTRQDAAGIRPEDIGPQEIDRLYHAFALVTPESYPRTARLLTSGTRRNAQKVIEEAGEVALEAIKHSRNGVIRESADILYHLAALWHRAGIDPKDIWVEMHRRVELLGIAEKLPKTRDRDSKQEPGAQAAAAPQVPNEVRS